MNWDELLERVVGEIMEGSLIGEGERVAVAVSGGVDSVVLFAALCELEDRIEGEWSVEAAIYIDHQLRPEETPAERRLVRELAQRYGKSFVWRKISFSAKEGSLQWGAREERLRVFLELSEELNFDKIALAHHADDLIETLIFRLLRGTSPDGLASIRVFSPPKFIRPLIGLYKEDIVSAAAKFGLKWLEDSSNSSDKYARNWIRHHLLPQMEEFNPNFKERLFFLARTARFDSDFFSERVDEFWYSSAVREFFELGIIVDLDRFRELAPSIRWRVVRRAVNRLVGGDIEQRHIWEIMRFGDVLSGGERYLIPRPDLRVIFSYKKLIFINERGFELSIKSGGIGEFGSDISIEGPGEYYLPCGRLIVRCKDSGSERVNVGERSFRIFWPELSGDPFPMVLRFRRGGERLKFGSGVRSLKRWFINAKVPKFLRDSFPLLEREGVVWWIPGLYWAEPLTEQLGASGVEFVFFPSDEWFFFADGLIFDERNRSFRDE